jgi:hypothetical protein
MPRHGLMTLPRGERRQNPGAEAVCRWSLDSDWLRLFFPAEPLTENREGRGQERLEARLTLQLVVDDFSPQPWEDRYSELFARFQN